MGWARRRRRRPPANGRRRDPRRPRAPSQGATARVDCVLWGYGLSPAELTTASTDTVLALAAATLAARIPRRPLSPSGGFFVGALAGAGVAASAGALFHGLRELAPAVVLWLLWRLVPLGIAVTSSGLLLAIVRARCADRTYRALGALLCLKLVAVVAFSMRADGLLVVGLDLGATLALLLAIETAAWIRGRRGAAFVVAGAVTTLVGLLVQVSGLRHGAPWNHNDGFHLMQVVGLCLFFAGARRICLDRGSAKRAADAPESPGQHTDAALAD
jgi:hypothetical protein